MMKICLAFVVLGIAGTYSMYRLPPDECPATPDASAPCTADCGDDPGACTGGRMCCTDSCGTSSCLNVTRSCTDLAGNIIPHRGFVPISQVDRTKDSCGFCWCFDGAIDCYRHACYVPGGPPVAIP